MTNEPSSTLANLADSQAFFASELFSRVQLAGLYSDSKTFADAVPKHSYALALEAYSQHRPDDEQALREFVTAHFDIPTAPELVIAEASANLSEYIQQLWPKLMRQPDIPKEDSLLPLPHSYVVPGGRFQEIYYWDSYFSALGLMQAGHQSLVVDMLKNFLTLQQALGFVPNGNRSYYNSRSQPPVLALMVALVLGDDFEHGDQFEADFVRRCIDGLEKEYRFWMQGEELIPASPSSHRRIVRMADGSVLNRYWDDNDTPRPESYAEDVALAQSMPERRRKAFYRDIRAGAESGWDFTSRWLAAPHDLSSIQTTRIVPVDLNALLLRLEQQLAKYYALQENHKKHSEYSTRAARRTQAIQDNLWNQALGFYCDYDLSIGSTSERLSLASAVPLYVGLATPAQAEAVARRLQRDFLVRGGLLTTTEHSHQQWDAPNGWAPLQCFAVFGLKRYGMEELANEVIERWLATVESYFARHGTLMEKYNLLDLEQQAEGGEYEVQHGFGWTNGVTQVFYQLQRTRR